MTDYSKTDPGMLQFIQSFYAAEKVGFGAVGLEAARAMLDAFPEMVDAPPAEVGDVRDIEVEGADGRLKARLYVPGDAQENSPGLIFFHGGGWVMGGLDSHDRPCRRICQLGKIPVLAVDYRLAPEHPFPAAVDDAEAAFLWACDHAGDLSMDKNRLAVGGDSAGGNIAASIALSLRGNSRGEPAFQLLIYPALQPFGSAPSHEKFSNGYALDTADMKFFISSYLQDHSNPQDPRAWPFFVDDVSDAAPAYIITGGQDPLQDDGAAYTALLQSAGVSVVHEHFPGMIHGFCSMTALSPIAMQALEDAARHVGTALRGGGRK
ncbi:Alpha/beta hydrolase fold-3 domain protein [hydrothermal vent metagenome]|uniref:Alpha/beta hydrolase fold-3 domain protein n=1 Tax=hydrothermal vent metagenome TaxID=652676 RepID=A0A3B0R9M8_9ZZZZ